MDKRDQILDSALLLFSKSGYEGTSLSQIASGASTQKQLITHHFGTKEKLWQEVVNRELEDGVDLLERVKQTTATEGAEAGLRHFIDEYIHWVSKKRAIHRIMFFDCQTDSPRYSWFTEKHTIPSHREITSLIKKAQKSGAVHEGNPGRLYFTFSNMISSLVLGDLQFKIYTGKSPFQKKEIEYLKSMVFKILGMTEDNTT